MFAVPGEAAQVFTRELPDDPNRLDRIHMTAAELEQIARPLQRKQGFGRVESLPGRDGDDSMSRADRIRVLIADGRPMIRRGIAAMLVRQDMQVVAEVETADDALAAWKTVRPALLMLDQELPSSGALPLLLELRQRDPEVRAVLVGRTEHENGILTGLRSGARAFLSATTTEADIVKCVRLVHAGQTFFPQSVAMLIASHLSSDPLTMRELEILALAAAGKSNKRIALALAIAESTVKSHMRSILSKTSTNSRTEATAVALRRGLVSLPR